MNEFLASLGALPVGSGATCDPPPTDTDYDYLVLGDVRVIETLVANGFTQDGQPERYDDMPDFGSWRKDNVNIICTFDSSFHSKFLLATKLAKKYNLLKKEDRIELFQAVLHGNSQE